MDARETAKTRLLKMYDKKQHGFWFIEGEDSNVDLGGPHYKPNLGYVKGRFDDVIEYALELPRFFSWGYGGDITLIEFTNVDGDSVERRKLLLKEKERVEKELAELHRKLKET